MKQFNITILFVFFLSLGLKAQFLQDINGKPVLELNYVNVEGTPFLYDYWTNGSAVTDKGKIYDKIALKYDNYNDKIYFKSDKDELFEFVEDIKSFTIEKDGTKEIYTRGFTDIDKFSASTFYEVLFKGSNMFLLYKPFKYVTETKAYNSATTEKKFNQNAMYYIFKDGKMNKFKPSKKDVLELFSNQTDNVNTFIKKENIDFKNNKDLTKLFDFYYTLN